MSELYQRVLMWHKMICQTTGGLALCSAKHRLNREEATRWVTYLRDAADDIEQFLKDGTFLLDSRGQRVVKSADRAALVERPRTDELPQPRTATGGGAQEGQHDVITPGSSDVGKSNSGATDRKIGGLRVATRRKT